MVRGSGTHYLRQKLWKCEDAGSFATILIESASPCTNNMANDTAIDDEEHQEATCQEGTLSGPQNVIPTLFDSTHGRSAPSGASRSAC